MPFIQQSSIKADISKKMLYFVQDLDCEIIVRVLQPPLSTTVLTHHQGVRTVCINLFRGGLALAE
ncbi:hypothetical protein P40081_23940 [Paenibacillus sp. FSL P4-0081]|nr:hypothetical protein P40081_23940 [Paenibacillus sp. FSL P4-0081]